MSQSLTRCVFLLFILSFWSVTAFAAPLTVQFSSEPSQYDPLLMEDGNALKLAVNTIGTAMEYDSNGQLQKALVESVVWNNSYTAFRFKFRKGLKWSDGVPFQADHFVYAIKRLATSKVKVALSALFPEIDLTATEVINGQEAVVVLKKSDPLFLQWCTLPPFAPIRKDMVSLYEKKHSPVVPTLAAYQVTEYKRDVSLVLQKNINFYDQSNVKIDQVKILILKDELNLLALVRAGKVDILNRVPVLQLDQIKKSANVLDVPVAATTYIGLNTRVAPFNVKDARKQLRDAVFEGQSELVKTLRTNELPAKTFLPRVLFAVDLPASGAKSVTLGPALTAPLTFQSDSGSRNQTILEFVQHLMKQKAGWKIQLDLLDWREHLARLKTAVPSAYRLGWQNPVADPFVFYQVLSSDSANNFTGWKSAEYDQLVLKLKTTPESDSKRKEMVVRLEEILAEEVPVIPVLHQVLRFSYSKRVSGFRANPFGVILFREIRLD